VLFLNSLEISEIRRSKGEIKSEVSKLSSLLKKRLRSRKSIKLHNLMNFFAGSICFALKVKENENSSLEMVVSKRERELL